ncbi:MAG: WYL domain-containing protein [Gammaproteobacteria bacterium]|nr:MAG: WYL domain-containing protein [Gammaproteobacteria bacterium]
MTDDIKWNTRQRFQYIELMAYYTGVISRSDLTKTFGLSDAAATKNLKLYSEMAPGNLVYQQNVFGFVPSESFHEMFADLSPAVVLPMIAANLAVAGQPFDEHPIYGVTVDTLPLPGRYPDKAVLAQIIRSIRYRKKLSVRYHSLTDSGRAPDRIIEPHSLINTGLRWHVRAYNEETYDFRDFVLSRFEQAKRLEQDAESSAIYDDDWTDIITLELAPHPGLNDKQRTGLLLDYGITQESVSLPVRRALIGYVLHRLSVDTTADHSMNPNVYQLIVLNREEIEPFASWAFM